MGIFERAAAEAGDAFQEALEAKLEGWKRLKEEGILDKIDESFSEEDINELDELSSKLLGRKLQTSKKKLWVTPMAKSLQYSWRRSQETDL